MQANAIRPGPEGPVIALVRPSRQCGLRQQINNRERPSPAAVQIRCEPFNAPLRGRCGWGIVRAVMFQIELHVGRLAEVRMVSPVTVEQIEKADKVMAQCVQRANGRVCICADFRRVTVMSTECADKLVAAFRRHNEGIERSAILVSANSAIAVLQIERVVRESNFPNRKAFRSTGEMQLWLGQFLTEAERARMTAFLYGPAH